MFVTAQQYEPKKNTTRMDVYAPPLVALRL